MSTAIAFHGATADRVSVRVLEGRTVVATLRDDADNRVSVFTPVGRSSIARELADQARIGETWAAQARHAAHEHRRQLRTDQFTQAAAAVNERRALAELGRTAA